MGKRVKQRSSGQRRRLWIALVLLAAVLLGLGMVWKESHAERGEDAPPAVEPAPTPAPAPKPAPKPAPAPAPEPTAAERVLAGMSLREKVCQLFIVYPSDLTGIPHTTVAGETTRQALKDFPAGGFLYDQRNLVNREQVRRMLTTVQTYSRIPLILTCDEEGGRVSRLMDTVGTTKIGPMLDYQEQGVEMARKNASVIGTDLRDCGFNLDLAPVADVWSNPRNTVIGDRAYSRGFPQAAELIPGAVQGFHQGGVACTLKHFPGHGDTTVDTHYGSATVTKSLDALRKEEFLPFQAGIRAGADAVMIGHLIVSSVDSEPAPFSHRLVTEILREELGFSGVVMTDGLRMKAMTDHYRSGEIAVKALSAGVDVLLCPEDPEAAAQGLMDAVEQGVVSQERLEESVLRILQLKERWGLLPDAA